MRVAVERVTWERFASSVGIGHGTNALTGEPVTFAGDWRPMRDIACALAAGRHVEVEVEDWQVLG